MTTQYAIAATVSGLSSLSAKLFAVNGDTVLYTADTVAERTNAKGSYLCTYGEVSVIPLGNYDQILFTAGGLALSKGRRRFTGTDTEMAIDDPLPTATLSDLSQGTPPATPTFEEAVMYLYSALRNEGRADKTASEKKFYNNAGVLIWKKAITKTSTLYTEAEGVSGP